MQNWYIFKKAQSDSLGYGAWLAPDGEVHKVMKEMGHNEVAFKIIFGFDKDDADAVFIDENDDDFRYPTGTLLEEGWARIINSHPGGRDDFSVHTIKQLTTSQERSIFNMIEFQMPRIIWVDISDLEKHESFSLKEALDLFGPKKQTYKSPLEKFR